MFSHQHASGRGWEAGFSASLSLRLQVLVKTGEAEPVSGRAELWFLAPACAPPCTHMVSGETGSWEAGRLDESQRQEGPWGSRRKT